ncbi:D-alanyl-D-alanine carboxypeptidase family protein [Miniphocaeibacter massiliensis]|uniref:D-alanyl-D-alanine carboxypeptidase family protein n=1 Tax=Miniphocaeibacter massiliensis TaxID=2041841 RepID=UPI000C08B324|nr:serine hydrolase [Miniphocaeibacter massiliensis]
MELKTKETVKYLFIPLLIFIAAICILFLLKESKFAKLELKSSNILLYNLTEDREEFSKKDKECVSPASLTKIMTVLVSIENIEDKSKIVLVDKKSYQEMVARNSSMAGFYGNEPVTYKDLLYGTMLTSGGECANSLAIHISGNVSEFVKLMNKKAKEIGMINTNFENPEGMDGENHYTTAEDIAKLLKYALKNEDFKTIFTAKEYTSTSTLDHPGGINIKSTVLSKLDGYKQKNFRIIGGKSGTTEKAGHCWATLVEKEDKEYICIVMGATLKENEPQIKDTISIMNEV